MDRESQSIALEKRHVHNVYDKIAPHFSDTRYKAWPRVKEFLLDLEPGSLVADVGKWMELKGYFQILCEGSAKNVRFGYFVLIWWQSDKKQILKPNCKDLFILAELPVL